MNDTFDITAEQQYYDSGPKDYYESPAALIENLMKLTIGDNWTDLLSGKKVLELGAGECSYVSYIISKSKPASYIASDVFDFRYKHAQSNLKNRFSCLQFQTIDATDINLDDNSVDLILGFGIYHHIPDLLDAFKEAWRILKPNGMLAIRDPYRSNPLIYLKHKIHKYSKNEKPLILNATKKKLEMADFQIEKISRFWLRFPMLPGGIWSTNIGIVARKPA